MKHAHPRPLRRREPLSRLGGFQVGPHQPDPRGWKVLSPDGGSVGVVRDLIVDTGRMRASYLDVELDHLPTAQSTFRHYRTSRTEDRADLGDVPVVDGHAQVTIAARSIVTLAAP